MAGKDYTAFDAFQLEQQRKAASFTLEWQKEEGVAEKAAASLIIQCAYRRHLALQRLKILRLRNSKAKDMSADDLMNMLEDLDSDH